MKQTLARPADEAGQTKPSTNGFANGSAPRAEPLPLAPSRTVRSRVPQALLAALLIVGGGLGGLLLFNSYNQRTAAVVVAGDVAHGSLLTRDDLAIAEVALDGNVATIGSISEAVGSFAAHDLSAGELLAPADLASEDQLLTSGESVIGLLLEPGQYPTKRLVAGDRVDIFAPGGEQFRPGPLAADLVVYEVVESSNDGRNLLVSVVVTADQAAAVFDASAGSGVRLSLRGQG